MGWPMDDGGMLGIPVVAALASPSLRRILLPEPCKLSSSSLVNNHGLPVLSPLWVPLTGPYPTCFMTWGLSVPPSLLDLLPLTDAGPGPGARAAGDAEREARSSAQPASPWPCCRLTDPLESTRVDSSRPIEVCFLVWLMSLPLWLVSLADTGVGRGTQAQLLEDADDCKLTASCSGDRAGAPVEEPRGPARTGNACPAPNADPGTQTSAPTCCRPSS